MTTNIKGTKRLTQEIRLLQEKEILQNKQLKYYANETLQSLNLMELVKSAVTGIISSPNLKQNLLDTSIGIGAGLLARNWYVGKSSNFMKKAAGFILQNLTTGIVAKKMPAVREKISAGDTK